MAKSAASRKVSNLLPSPQSTPFSRNPFLCCYERQWTILITCRWPIAASECLLFFAHTMRNGCTTDGLKLILFVPSRLNTHPKQQARAQALRAPVRDKPHNSQTDLPCLSIFVFLWLVFPYNTNMLHYEVGLMSESNFVQRKVT